MAAPDRPSHFRVKPTRRENLGGQRKDRAINPSSRVSQPTDFSTLSTNSTVLEQRDIHD